MITVLLTVPAFAITEADVEAQVSATSKETVTGNVLIWFLCAIAFLKVSQKVDSFMASLGVNVGHTGSSMLAEVMLATRGVTAVAGKMGYAFGGKRMGGSGAGAGTSGSSGWFLKGGLAGMVSRKITNDAVRTATTATSAVNSVKSSESSNSQSSILSEQKESGFDQTDTQHTAEVSHGQIQSTSEQTESQIVSQSDQVAAQSVLQSGQGSQEVESHTHTSHTQTSDKTDRATSRFKGIGLGGAVFAQSLLSGGKFATDVIGTVARGDIRSTGSMKGDLAAQAVAPYLRCDSSGAGGKGPLTFSNVEIGGGRITGEVQAPGQKQAVAFSMYHADQYMEPREQFKKFHTADGALWYTQFAQDTVERKPYKAPDGSIAYDEQIVKKLPNPPKRKDRI